MAPPDSVRWVTSRTELTALASIVDPVNIASWNGVDRRVAVTYRMAEPIGVAWIAIERFDEPQLGLHIELAAEEAWIHSAFVAPQFRRQGIYHHLLDYVTRSLRDEGFHRVLLGVTNGNESSRLAHEAASATAIGQILAAKSCGICLCFTSGMVLCRFGRRTHLARTIKLRIRSLVGAE